jgi:hypothetical protein
MLKDLYSSKLHILKNKYLKQSYLKLDIYNKSVVITSFDKNLYFFRTELFEFLDTLYNTNKHNFNILALFSNSRIIDISTFYRYKKNNIITFFNFFKKISSINLKTVYNKNIFVLLFSNILILDYYILFNVNFLLN